MPGLPLDSVRRRIAEVMHPASFFVGRSLALEWAHHAAEEVFWEIFQGQALDGTLTRRRQTFEAWNVYLPTAGERSAEPVLSVKLDAEGRVIHVTRAVLCHAWESYDAGGDVILSRETRRWHRELAGTIPLADCGDLDALTAELSGLLFRAVVGSSRLPLTSVEAPLPAFSLGGLAYFPSPGPARTGPRTSYRELIREVLAPGLSGLETVKLLETVIRSTPAAELAEAADLFANRRRAVGRRPEDLPVWFRSLFDEVSLSPYTDFVDKALLLVQTLEERGHLTAADRVDFLSYLLRQQGRHLTAYDLVVFHHRGANYPDALLVEAVLKEYLHLIARYPALFLDAPGDVDGTGRVKRMRRRALRQGWLLYRWYEGHPVPDSPTSPGENLRVLPPPHVRVPEEQILDPRKRKKGLFAGDPLGPLLHGAAQTALQQAIGDLHQPAELRELGLALFVDRPLGTGKGPGEPDRTPLFSYEAFSRSIAERRLDFLTTKGLLDERRRDVLKERIDLCLLGLALAPSGRPPFPGRVSLDDALRAAGDFLLLRTTDRTVADFRAGFDLAPLGERLDLDYLRPGRRVLIVDGASVRQESRGSLFVYDATLRRRLELQVDNRSGFVSRGGCEYPVPGLRVLRTWTDEGTELDLREKGLVIPPRR